VTSYFNSGGNFRGRKGSVYEGGFRVPGIVRWSGHVKPGGESDRVVGFEDWMPPLLELIGHKDAGSPAKVARVDGISFAPTLLGQAQPPRPFLYREFPTRGGAQFIRVDNWRLVRHLGNNDRPDPVQPGEENAEEQVINRKVPGAPDPNPRGGAEFELFDLSADPSEQKNVADAHPEVVAKLKRILVEQHTPSKLFPLRGIDPPRGARRGE